MTVRNQPDYSRSTMRTPELASAGGVAEAEKRIDAVLDVVIYAPRL
jgi:hypothetical protein